MAGYEKEIICKELKSVNELIAWSIQCGALVSDNRVESSVVTQKVLGLVTPVDMSRAHRI